MAIVSRHVPAEVTLIVKGTGISLSTTSSTWAALQFNVWHERGAVAESLERSTADFRNTSVFLFVRFLARS